MTVVVTGAAGLVGLNLVRALLAEGRTVRAMIYTEQERPRFEGLNVELVLGDVTRLETLQAAFAGAEVVYHLAGAIILDERRAPLAEKVNIGGVKNVLHACQTQGVRRLIHFSSYHVQEQKPYDRPIDENSPYVAENCPFAYPRTKAAGERLVLAAQNDLEVVVIRPTAILGEYDYEHSSAGAQLILGVANRKFLALVQGGCSWVDVRDLLQAALTAEKFAPSGSVYLLSGHYTTVRELVELVGQVTGVPTPSLYIPIPLADKLIVPVMDIWSRVSGQPFVMTHAAMDALQLNPKLSSARAQADLNFRLRPLEETIRDVYGWYQGQGLVG